MVGQASAPAWLETDWVLGPFVQERSRAQAGFVRQGNGQPSVWEGLRHQLFLGGAAFAQQHGVASKLLERLREVPRARHRSLAEPLADLAHRYPDAREAMAQTYQTGVYSMREIADHFGVHYATVSRSVRQLKSGRGAAVQTPPRPVRMLDCNT